MTEENYYYYYQKKIIIIITKLSNIDFKQNYNNIAHFIIIEPGVSKLIDSKQPGVSKHFMFPKISFSA